MTTQTKETLTLANCIEETNVIEFMSDWKLEPPQHLNAGAERRIAVPRNGGDNRTAFIMTTDLDSGNDAQDLAAVFGLDLQIRFPREGLPIVAAALFVAIDELLLDAHGRREYLDRLWTLKLPFPIIILSFDFQFNPPTVVRPGLMLAMRLDDDVFRAFRDGHIHLPSHGVEGRKAA